MNVNKIKVMHCSRQVDGGDVNGGSGLLEDSWGHRLVEREEWGKLGGLQAH